MWRTAGCCETWRFGAGMAAPPDVEAPRTARRRGPIVAEAHPRPRRRGILAVHVPRSSPIGERPTRDRACGPASTSSARPAPRSRRRALRPRSSSARCATASRRASIAATSSRSTPTGGSSASSATRTGSSPSASTVKPFGVARAHRGRRDRGVRPRAGRDRDHGELPLRRGPPCPDAPGHLSAAPASARRCSRLRRRGHAARRADRGAPGPRRREGRARSATCAPASTPSCCSCPGCKGWDPDDYWQPSHPSQVAYRAAVARAFGDDAGAAPDGDRRLRRRDLRLPAARGRPRLRDARRPGGAPGAATRGPIWRGSLTIVRDAMLANPEMVGGRHDRLDTSLMKAAPGRLVSKGGMEALRGVAILPGPRAGHQHRDGVGHGGQDRGRRRLRPRDLGGLGRGACARPASLDGAGPAGARPLSPARDPRPARTGRGEAIADFELAPVGELIG